MVIALIAMMFMAPAAAFVSGKTFFTDISMFQLNRPARLAMFREDRRNIKHDGFGGSFQAVAYGGRSTNSSEISRYFLPNNLKDSAIAAEIDATLYLQRKNDILAEYFDVATAPYFSGLQTYASRLCFKPKKEVIGLGLTYLQRLGNKWWADISLPIERARSTMGLTETILEQGGGVAVPDRAVTTNMIAAFNNPAYLHYGRINGTCWNKSPVRVGDIEMRVGKDVIQTDCAIVGGYIGAVVGAGNKPKAVYMFEPIVGNNGHSGVMFGSYGRFALIENLCGFGVTGVLDIASRFLFTAKELRSFDLKGQPWSRYFGVWSSPTATSLNDIQPLINYTTLMAKVSPNFNSDFNTGVVIEKRGWQVEMGYNTFSRHTEDIELCQSISPTLGIASIQEFVASGGTIVATKSYSKIQRNTLAGVTSGNITDVDPAEITPTYVPIRNCDIDVRSAAHPTLFAYLVYANIGYSSCDCDVPWFFNLGGSYNFCKDNAALERWTFFVKGGLTF